MYYTYVIQNKINNKIYIGQTNDIQYRWFCHKNNAYNSNTDYYNTYIAKAIRKYGEDNFIFTELESYENIEDCNEAEEFWIGFFSSHNHSIGYNLKLGGNNHKMTEETKKKIGASNKISQRGKKLTEEHKNNISNALQGTIFTEEHKNKLSQSLKGKQNCLNRILSEETKNKISKSNLGNKNALGTKQSIDSKLKRSRNRLILTLEQVENIISNSNFFSTKELSKKYNVSVDTIRRVVKGIYFTRVKE